MTNFTRILFWILLPVFLWLSCEKNILDPQSESQVLPPLTTTGVGTFGCKINGEIFLPTPKAFDDHVYAEYHQSSKTFQVKGIESVNDTYHRSIGIFAEDIKELGIYQLTNVRYRNYDDTCQTLHGLNVEHRLENELFEVEIIHFSEEDRIISGTFQYTVVSERCQDTFRITDGRFDMPWLK